MPRRAAVCCGGIMSVELPTDELAYEQETVVDDDQSAVDDARGAEFADGEESQPRVRSPRIGDLLVGKYRVERVGTRRGASVQLEAQHLQLGQSVVVKVLLADARSEPEAV